MGEAVILNDFWTALQLMGGTILRWGHEFELFCELDQDCSTAWMIQKVESNKECLLVRVSIISITSRKAHQNYGRPFFNFTLVSLENSG